MSKNCKNPGVLFRTSDVECGRSTKPVRTPFSSGVVTYAFFRLPRVPSSSEFNPDTNFTTGRKNVNQKSFQENEIVLPLFERERAK